MHFFQLLLPIALILHLSASQLTVTLMNSSITVTQTNSSLPLGNSTAANICGRLVARNNFLYHLSSSAVLEYWNLSDFSTKLGEIDLSADLGFGTKNVIDFDVNLAQSQFAILDTADLSAEVYIYSIDAQAVFTRAQTYSKVAIPSLPTQIFVIEEVVLRYYQNTNGSDYMVKTDLANVSTIYPFTHSNASMVLTPDRRMAAAWTMQTQVFFYSTDNFTLLNIFNSSISNVFYSTGSINFNQDSSLAVIQADKYSTVKIVNLTDFKVAKSYSIGSNVVAALFISSDYVVLLGSGVVFWSISNDKQFTMTSYSINVLSYYMDNQHNSLYACYQNKIDKYIINDNTSNSTNTSNLTTNTTNTTSTPTNSTNNSMNNTNSSSSTTTQSNTTQFNNSSPSSKGKTADYYSYPLEMTDSQQLIYQGLATTMSSATTALYQKVMIIATSTPLTFYFLSFLNYLNFCSLYVLLQLQIPQPVFNRLSEVYISINTNLLSIIGINPPVPSLSSEKVNSLRALYFGLTSDFSSANYLPLVMMIFNCICSEIINHFVSRLERHKWNFLRRALFQDRFTVFSGQIIAAMIGITVPWRFALQASSLNVFDKLNTIVYEVFFLLVVAFPWVYLLELLRRRRKKMKKATKSCKFIKWSSLLTQNVLQEWYTCLSNFFYPFLVILSKALPFLAAVTPYCFLGIYFAHRTIKWRINNIILSIYPLIFHLTFIVFSISHDDSLLANSGIVCLTVLMLGAVHNLLTLMVSTIHGLCSYSQKRKSQNRIQPSIAKQTVAKIENAHTAIAQQLIIQSKLAFKFRIMRQMDNKPHDNPTIKKEKRVRTRRTDMKNPKKPHNNLMIRFQNTSHPIKPKKVCVQ